VSVTPSPTTATTEANFSIEKSVLGCRKLSSVAAKNTNSTTVIAMKP
jgi:hypothetical protein